MVHKKAYYSGLCKIAAAELKTFYGAQVGRGTRTNTLPTTDVMVNGKALTYGDLGFQDTGVHKVNWANLDNRKAEAAKQGKQYDPSFIEFITDENLSGQHYIPRDSIDSMSHEMARIRGGQTPLSKRNVDHSDTLKYLNQAYKHYRNKYYKGNANYLDSAIAAYQTYRQDRNPIAYKEQDVYQAPETGTLPTPKRIQVPTAPVAKTQDTKGQPQAGAYLDKYNANSYQKRLVQTFNLLNQDYYKHIHDALMAGEAFGSTPASWQNKYKSNSVPAFLSERGYARDQDYKDWYVGQRQYLKDYDNYAKYLGFLNDDGKWNTQKGGRMGYHRALQDLYARHFRKQK